MKYVKAHVLTLMVFSQQSPPLIVSLLLTSCLCFLIVMCAAGLNLATHGSNFAVASKALTDAWTDSLAGPADQELAFDYDSINAGLFAGGAAGRTGAGGMDVHIDAVVNDIHIDDLNLDDLDL